MDSLDRAFSEETGLDTTRQCQDIQSINAVGYAIRLRAGSVAGHPFHALSPWLVNLVLQLSIRASQWDQWDQGSMMRNMRL